jgi:hypothetical protein
MGPAQRSPGDSQEFQDLGVALTEKGKVTSARRSASGFSIRCNFAAKVAQRDVMVNAPEQRQKAQSHKM